MSVGRDSNGRFVQRARSALRRIASAFLALAMVMSLAAHAGHAHQSVPSGHTHAAHDAAAPAEVDPSSMDGDAQAAADDCCQCCAPNVVVPVVVAIAPRAVPAIRPLTAAASRHGVHRTIEAPPPRT